jgi:hypothetical protein
VRGLMGLIPFCSNKFNLSEMDTPRVYEIRVEGLLADLWSEWFEGLVIYNDPDGDTTLRGLLIDQAALFCVLAKIHDLNLILISVYSTPVENGTLNKFLRS